MELVLPNNYVEIEEEEMMYLDGGDWWGLVSDIALIFSIEKAAANYVLGAIAVSSPWMIPVMTVIGVGSAATFIWRVYEQIF